ncbi:hypothetical protein PFAG_03482 [Plasmodium falciparum Santa Lucia]|uniref:Uncharacterized protein n=3 Tax=Plasmodium falciparum TaxID=5833 RepID=A0A024W5F6_PLAFA|nr:hypothetical protein PFFVO_05612 [Plasmodium falciparum Vietnam Oak-Knoll (FVO)]ETW35902.1 hypothetical protein PFTANZ_03495 [Plasmodium falciparum Tanzania (2000708)]EUT83607.1 hypothetical protein PFAG_03482 [Plasmodium falciparum Santa Lucia]
MIFHFFYNYINIFVKIILYLNINETYIIYVEQNKHFKYKNIDFKDPRYKKKSKEKETEKYIN